MSSLITGLRLSAYTLAILGLSSCAYICVRLGLADLAAQAKGQNAVASVRRASEMARGNAAYWLKLASLISVREDSPDSVASAYRAAAASNPNDSGVLLALGLASESKGDFIHAERHFLQAARNDLLFSPRWALTNFYYRRGDSANFWRWARETAEVSYDDTLPALFRLCWIFGEDENTTFERVVPNRPRIEARYVSFLLAENRLDAAATPVQRLLEKATADETATLLDYCDRLIQRGDAEKAVATWNALSARKLIRHPALIPATGASLTNGNFAAPVEGRGFDWRLPNTPDVSTRLEQPPALQIRFSGKQPEQFELLSQFVPILPAYRYELQLEYQTSGITSNTGLQWLAYDAGSGIELAHGPPEPFSDNPRIEKIGFRTAESCTLVRLVFRYQRQPGTTKIEGSIRLRNVTLQLLQRQ